MSELSEKARRDASLFMEARMVRDIVNSFFKIMQGRYKSFPDDYLVFDVETTGFKLGEDLIAQLGYVKVRDRKVADKGWVYLDWTRDPDIDQEWLKERIARTRHHVEWKDGQPTGKSYKVSYEDMRHGMDPRDALGRYLRLFEDNRKDNCFFVAHNGYNFDARWLEAHFLHFIGNGFVFDDYELFDTGATLKASQAAMAPWQGESVRDFSMRISRTWLKGVHWSLNQYAVKKYNLDRKYGFDVTQMHDASLDCLVTHYLFEEMRDEAAAVASGGPPIVRGTDADRK